MQVFSFVRTKAFTYTLWSTVRGSDWREKFHDSVGFGVETYVGAIPSCVLEARVAFHFLRYCLITFKAPNPYTSASSPLVG